MRAREQLLERRGEERALSAALDRARGGAGALVVLEAPGGLGKTSLLREAHALADGMRMLRARGSELEAGFPFGVVRQLFEPLLYQASPEDRARWLAGAAALAGAMFEPSAPAAGVVGDDATFQRLHGLYWLTANLSDDRPLVVSVDDAQWADDPSLQFLGFLARRVEALPVLLLVATRPVNEESRAALTQLVADPSTEVLRPRALSTAAVERRLADALGTDPAGEFVQACRAATLGNPLLLSELLRELTALELAPTATAAARVHALGPQGVGTVVLSRLARMPAAGAALARALAILGDGAALQAAAELAGLPAEEAVGALRALLAAEVVVEGDGLAFVHPIVRAAVYDSIPDRSAEHWRAARTVAVSEEAIGAQLLAAQPAGDPWAVEALREAARRALALGDARGAVTHLRRALAEPPPGATRAAVLLELGRAQARAGDPEAIAHLELAMEEARDGRAAAQAALELAPVLKFAGESVRAVAVTERGLDRLGDADPALAEQLEVELIGSAYISIAARKLLAPRLAALPEPPQVPVSYFDRFRLTGLAFDAFAAGRPADEVADLATRGLAYGGMATDPTAGGHAFVSGAIALMFAERYDEADRLYSGALDDARRRGSGIAFATASSLRSLVAYRRGRLGRRAGRRLGGAGARARRARRPRLPLGRARHVDLHRARPGHGRRRARGLRRSLRARAGGGQPPLQPCHAQPCLSAHPSRRARGGLPGAAGHRPPRARMGRAQPGRHALALDGRAGRAPARRRRRPRGRSRSKRSSSPARSGRRAHSAWRCARPGSWPAARKGSRCWPRPWRCSSGRSARSSTPAR